MKRLIAILLVVIFLAPADSYAHTALVSSFPKDRAVLSASPKTISLTFNENLIKISGKSVSRISLFNRSGKQISTGKASLNKSKISVSLKNPLTQGSYTVRFRVVSSDGHPVTGLLSFSVS